MSILLFFLFVDTLVAELAWPYYVSPSTGYKAVKFNPQLPCSISQFLCCVGSPMDNATKSCSIVVWCDGSNQPGPRLFSDVFNINVVDSGKLYWTAYDFSPPLHMVGAFWIGLWENNSFPTTVFDAIPSFRASYSLDGTNWDSVAVDYFYVVAVRQGHPQLHINPGSLNFHVNADTNQSDTAVLTVINGSVLYNLSVDSMVCNANWVLSVKPSSFGLFPMDSKEVEVVCGNVSSDGVYYDTLFIFSDDPYNNPCPVPLTLTVTGYVVEENVSLKVQESKSLKVYPNPFVQMTGVSCWWLGVGENQEVEMKIYDISGRIVRGVTITNPQSQISIGQELVPGVYFVKAKGYKLVKIIKLRQ